MARTHLAGILARLRIPVLILAIVIAFCWKIVLTHQYEWMWSPDLANQVLPWFEAEARLWHSGTFPMWDPHLWAGQPLLGQGQPGAAYPLNWLLFSLPLRRHHIAAAALAWYLVAIHFMAALFCYGLARSMGRSRRASLLAAFVFSFGCFLSFYDWPQMMNGAVWGPAVFFFLTRVRTTGRRSDAALAGAALGMSWLSGHHQVPIYITLAAAAFYIWTWLHMKTARTRLAGLAALSGLTLFLIGALQLLPAWEYGHLAIRFAGVPEGLDWSHRVPYSVHAEYSLGPLSVVGIIDPEIARYATMFVGLVAFALSLIGVARCWRDWRVRFLAALALAGYLYALGGISILQGLLYAVVPFVEKARSPATAVYLFGLGCSLLAAFGLDEIHAADESLRRYVRILVIFGSGLGGVLLVLAIVRHIGFDDHTGLIVVTAFLLAAVLYGAMRNNVSHSLAATLCVLLSMLELGSNFGVTWPNHEQTDRVAPVNHLRGHQDVAAYLKAQPAPFRIETDGNEIVSNWADFEGLDALNGGLASVTSNMFSTDPWTENVRKLFGVRYTVARKPTAPSQTEVYSSPDGMKVYLNPDVFPRAWVVHQLLAVKDTATGKQMVQGNLSQLHSAAWIVKPGAPPPAVTQTPPGCADDQLTIQRFTATRQTFDAKLACDGFLIISDTYYPGWGAKVDGRSVPLFESNGAMQAVAVPRGSHAVEVSYRPLSVLLGGCFLVVGILICGMLAFLDRGLRADQHEFTVFPIQ
ncbi:MAG TPA: hypothetical protein VKR61_13270 [Bryobacteraceae bacterium]|nr:hypothetical protein [Bryobacteraceae bacterium]